MLGADASEQEWSLEQSSQLNDAYRTLRDPIKRTQYLLALEGVELEEQSKSATEEARATGEVKKQIVPPELLEEVFELNMQLEELRMNKKMGEDDPALIAEIAKPRPTLEEKHENCFRSCSLTGKNGTPLSTRVTESLRPENQSSRKMVDVLNRRNYIRQFGQRCECGAWTECWRLTKMRLNEYITLGRSGLRVSPLCLGTMTFGTEWGWGSEENVSRSIFDGYIEAGGNFIDTADGYTGGKSEEHGRQVHRRAASCAIGWCSPRSSRSTPSPAIRTRAATAARTSIARSKARCADCRPTTSILLAARLGHGHARSKRSSRP